MSLHDTFLRLATIDDDDTARVLAVALNADAEIRRITTGGTVHWTATDIKRVARTLAAHAGVNEIVPRAAGRAAVARAIEEPELDLIEEEE